MLGVPVTQASTTEIGGGDWNTVTATTTLPPVQYSDPESDEELETTKPLERSHIYRKLTHNEIRLLILNPGKADDRVECYLEHYSINAVKPYFALSYVWGSTTDKRLIQLDGCPFKITSNLCAFLKTFRLEYECSVLWIDALCINQEDLPERNAQIRLMKRVYEGAEKVVIWLGEEIEDTQSAFEHMHNTQARFLGRDDKPSHLSLAMLHLEVQKSGSASPNVLNGIRDILQRSWWKRIWVYQEATAPAKGESLVVCGSQHIGFKTLLDYIQRVGSTAHAGSLTSTVHVMNDYLRLRSAYHEQGISDFLRLSDLLPALRGFDATNPRDKLYALIPTSIDGNDLLDIDYSLSVEDFYSNSACSILRRDNNLDFLGNCTHPGEQSNLKLPSWVPDWTLPDPPVHICKVSHLGGTLYRASRRSERELVINAEHRTLTVACIIFDTVCHVSYSSGGTIDEGISFNEWAAWLESLQYSAPPYATQDGPPDVEKLLLRTMVMDCVRTSSYKGRRLRKMRLTSNEKVEHTQTFKQRMLDSLADKSVQCWTAYRQTLLHRKLLVSEKSYLGLASKHVQPGDLITILKGAQVPMILRRENDHYLLVGEAYVDGIMDGEGITNIGSDGWQSITIK